MSWKKEDAQVVRDMIKHENELISHRLGWLLASQGFLFTAAAFVLEKKFNASSSSGGMWAAYTIIYILALVGIMSAISTAVSTRCANQAICELWRSWDKNKPDGYDGPDVIGLREQSRLSKIFLPWFLLPSLLMAAWVGIVVLAFAG